MAEQDESLGNKVIDSICRIIYGGLLTWIFVGQLKKKMVRSPISEETEAAPQPTNNDEKVRQTFVYDLLSALDRRRSAVDARCAVVFAISGVSLGLFLGQMKQGELLYHNNENWRIVFAMAILCLLLSALVLGLSLIAPIARTRKRKKAEKGKEDLSWFYLIAESNKQSYYELLKRQTQDSVLQETCKQVFSISTLLRKRYNRLQLTTRILYLAFAAIAFYVLSTIFRSIQI